MTGGDPRAAPRADPRLEERLGDRFEVTTVDETHDGAFRARVRDTELDRPGRAWVLTSPDLVEEADTALRLLGRLRHPCVSPLHDAGLASIRDIGGIFVIRRLHVGATLRDRLTAQPLDVNEAVAVLEQVAHAVAAVHAIGQSLGDLASSGIVLDTVDGGAYLLDPLVAGLRHHGAAGPGAAFVDEDLRALAALVIEMLTGAPVPSEDRTPHRLPRLGVSQPEHAQLDRVLAEAVRPDDPAFRHGPELAREVRDALVGVLSY